MARFALTSPDGEALTARLIRIVKVLHQRGMLGELRLAGVPGLLAKLLGHRVGPGILHTLGAANHPQRLAVVAADGRWDYRAYDELINRTANLWLAHGLRQGDRIVLMSPNSGHYGAAYMASFRAGMSAVHASYRLTEPELRYMIEHSGACAIWFHSLCSVAVARLPEDLRKTISLFEVGGTAVPGAVDFLAELPQHSSTMPPRPGLKTAHENIVYTSGTTGKPKGAVRDMAGLQIDEPARILEGVPIQAATRHLVVSPMYHSAGQLFFILSTLLGNTTYIVEHFDPETVLKTLCEENIDSVFLVPTMIQRILMLPESVLAQYRPDLAVLISGAAPFSHDLRMRAIRYFGAHCLYDFYGSTETGWITLINGSEMATRPGSVGRPISGTRVQILREDGSEADTGETGELYTSNHMVIDGYHNDADATESAMRGSGFSAGDLAWVDADGYLYLAGRAKEMILSGGVNIYPRELEEAIDCHPDVAESAVVGIADSEWGEVVGCALVVEPGSELDLAALTAWLRERLAGYKIPRRWLILAELPRNPTGKVLKRILQERFAKGS